MKVFLSWSRDFSKELAIEFREWISCVIHTVEPFMSKIDIQFGTVSLEVLRGELSESKVGIVFITPDNCESPWINYEVGALAFAVDKPIIIPILFGVNSLNNHPLSQFQMPYEFNKENMRSIVHLINNNSVGITIKEHIINKTFDALWDDFEIKILNITQKYYDMQSRPKQKLNNEEMFSQISIQLESTNNYVANLASAFSSMRKVETRFVIDQKYIIHLKDCINGIRAFHSSVDTSELPFNPDEKIEEIDEKLSSLLRYLRYNESVLK